MNPSIATPDPEGALRRFLALSWIDPEWRSTTVGITAVVLFCLVIIVELLFGSRGHPFQAAAVRARRPQQFNIEIAPDTFVKPPPPKPKLPTKFVETNPDAPENTPDKTNNFSDRNQQVAQEKPTPDGKNDRPALEGKKDFDSTQIVTGQLQKVVEHVEVAPPSESNQNDLVKAPKREMNPLTGFEKKQSDDPSAYGSNVAKFPAGTKPDLMKQVGVKNAPDVPDAYADQPAIDPHHPRARPQIVKQQQVRPAIFAENKIGTSNIGPIAVDAKWSNYGAYLQRMIEIVQIEWERILIESSVAPASGSEVTVKFVMNSEGKITRIVNVDGSASDSASRACVSGITIPAPYGPWTEDMKAMLGEEQEMTFRFYYN